MRTVADTAFRSLTGLFVVTAMLLTIWVARGSSDRSAGVESARDAESPAVDSVRVHRPGTR